MRQSGRIGKGTLGEFSMESIKDGVLGLLMIPLLVAYAFGGFIGAVYWAIKGDILAVVLSIFIPFFGAISVLWDLLF